MVEKSELAVEPVDGSNRKWCANWCAGNQFMTFRCARLVVRQLVVSS